MPLCAPVRNNLKIYSIEETAQLLGKTEDWLRRQIRAGTGPPARKVSPRCIVVRHKELMQWLDSLEFTTKARLYGEPDPELTINVGEDAEGQ
jgi:hypothetical protein